MSLIINDVIFLRRPTLNYVCPPVCENLFSSTGFPVIVVNPVPHHAAPIARIVVVEGGFELQWDAYPGAICFNIYKAVNPDFPDGAYEIILECIPGLVIPVDPGCYRVSAITIDGESDLSLAVCTPVGPSAPEIITDPATDVELSATLNGRANPNRSGTTVYFEWGLTTAYGNSTAPQAIGDGHVLVSFSASISGLSGFTEYHFRAVAVNSQGTAFGNDESFVTGCDPNFPQTIPGLESWWKADSLVLNNGDPVSLWEDSNLANDASGSGATRPTYETNVFGDKPVVHFDGTDDQLDLASTLILGMSPGFTMIVVFAWDSDSAPGEMLFGTTLQNDWLRLEPDIACMRSTSATNVCANFTVPTTDARALFIRGEYLFPTRFIFRENKTSMGEPGAGGFGNTWEVQHMGVGFVGFVTPFFFKGRVAEILVYGGAPLDDTTCDLIYDQYLKCKYSNLP